MAEQRTPANTPAAGNSDGRNVVERLTTWSLSLAFAAPFVGMLSIVLASSGANCSVNPTPNYFAMGVSRISIFLYYYYGAILAGVGAFVLGGLALLRARRPPRAQIDGCGIALGILLGLLFAGILIYPGHLFFSLLYDVGTHGGCLEI